jgi:DNA-binding CsgD family transcriptional regulator
MRGPKPPLIVLSSEERQELDALLRRHSTPQQIALRARIVLAAAAGKNNGQIVRELDVSREMVRLWRTRWLALAPLPLAELSAAERLADIPRSGRQAQISAAAVCKIVALACDAPATSGRPISQWSAREIADEVISRGIVERISPRHAARLLKRGISSPTGSAIG